MNYRINFRLAFLLIILSYGNRSTHFITCIITKTWCSWYSLASCLRGNTEGVTEAESSVLPWGHRHWLSGGTATPRAVPTWTWFRAAAEGLSPDVTVYTAMCRAVHRQVLSDGTATFFFEEYRICQKSDIYWIDQESLWLKGPQVGNMFISDWGT